MKKLILFIFISVIVGILTTADGQNKFYDLTKWGTGYLSKISPNGKYIIGSSSKFGNYLWDIVSGDTLSISTSNYVNLYGVNDQADVVGVFPDSTLMINSANGQVAAVSAGLYKNKKWYSLGGGQISLTAMGTRIDLGSIANGISNDGKTVAGMSYNAASSAKVVPFMWKLDDNNAVVDTVTYNYPTGEQGSRFWDISSDGTRGCGYAVYPGTYGFRRPIVFLSPTEYKIINPNKVGEAFDISPNGKYVALNTGGYAAIYDVDADSLIYCGNVKSTYPSSVSDNGVVVGYHTIYSTLSEGRKGFVWSKKTGYIELEEFFKTYAPDIVLPSDMAFNDSLKFDVPMSISGDGLTIGGWSGYTSQTRYGWLVKLDKALEVAERPYNLIAKTDIEKRNEITFTWKIDSDVNHTLTGFKIYRESELVTTINDPSTVSYILSDAKPGYWNYYVRAVYTDSESPLSDYVSTVVVNTYDLPFSENFESQTLTENYWVNNFTTTNNYWGKNNNSGVAKSVCTFFYTKASAVQYENYLQSKPLDATNSSSVYLSFIYKVQTSVLTGLTDTLYVEVSPDINGTSWNVAKKYLVIQQPQVYTPELINISDYAGGKMFRVRFRFSGKDRKTFYYYLDNIAISTSIPEAPKDLKVTKQDLVQQITWKEPSGSYGLTYSSTKPTQSIGDEGTPFIAANKFESAETKQYTGKYLTSITAYINQSLTQGAGITPTKLKTVVFKDNVKVIEEDVTSFIPNKWNTFKLSTPVEITANSTIMFGMLVTKHDPGEFPLYTDNSVAVDGKGNLFSEDNGASWQKLSDFGLTHNWSIIGNVRDAQAEVERDGDVLGYEVFRNNTKINTDFIYAQQYTDSSNYSKADYSVRAIYSTKGISEMSVTFVFDASAVQNTYNNDFLEIPSTIRNGFIIKSVGTFDQFRIIDSNGKLVMSDNFISGNYTDVSNLPEGIYYITAYNKSNSVTKKFIKLNK